jgi:hypothetical protein
MKIDTDALVDQRSATIQYLDSDTMDEERLSEAMAYINAKYEALPAAMYARLCGRVAWHVRKIGRFHQTNADRLERVNRDFPDPKLGDWCAGSSARRSSISRSPTNGRRRRAIRQHGRDGSAFVSCRRNSGCRVSTRRRRLDDGRRPAVLHCPAA